MITKREILPNAEIYLVVSTEKETVAMVTINLEIIKIMLRMTQIMAADQLIEEVQIPIWVIPEQFPEEMR